MELQITKAAVLLTNGADKILLMTNAPCPFVPEGLPEQPPLSVSFEATVNTGERYCLDVLGIKPEVINARSAYSFRSKHGSKTHLPTHAGRQDS